MGQYLCDWCKTGFGSVRGKREHQRHCNRRPENEPQPECPWNFVECNAKLRGERMAAAQKEARQRSAFH